MRTHKHIVRMQWLAASSYVPLPCRRSLAVSLRDAVQHLCGLLSTLDSRAAVSENWRQLWELRFLRWYCQACCPRHRHLHVVWFRTSLFVCGRLHKLGLLGHTLYRLTDSGPDNDAKESHAMHTQLVSMGCAQLLIWIRLMPKHSHNLSDRFNAMVKEQIWPHKGAGGGCKGPWDMENIIHRAIQSQKGTTEFAWQWQNMDWTQMYSGHFHRDFKGYGDQRYWIYKYDKNLPQHHYVNVTYRANLLQPESNASEPEFLPCLPNEQVCTPSPPPPPSAPHPCLSVDLSASPHATGRSRH